MGGGTFPQHKISSHKNSSNPLEPREVLEEIPPSTYTDSPREQVPQGPKLFCTDVGGAGVQTSPDPCPVPRPLSCAEGDGVHEYGEPRFAGSRPYLAEGNRIYVTI